MKLSLLMYTLETSVASRSSSNPWLGLVEFVQNLALPGSTHVKLSHIR